MSTLISLIVQYERWVYGLLGLVALFYLRAVWAAYQRLEVTPFGLEKDAARRRLNASLAVLFAIAAFIAFIFTLDRYILPNLAAAQATPGPEQQPTAIPSPTPIQSAQPLVVDSSGCANPNATLVKPEPNERISNAYEVIGTADILNFAFYKIEISGLATSGAWVTLGVGNQPVRNDILARFDPNPYEPGEYAFRLVVTDNTGGALPPCVIVVTFAP
jgi:hypothetical protein